MNLHSRDVLSRRHFLGQAARLAGSASLLGTVGSFQNAFAATADTSGYKALVCLYLSGGNDGFNTVVPTTTAGYSAYSASRGSLALAKSSLLALNGTASDGYSYGLHPSCKEMQSLFNSGHVAILCNVGTLVQPTTVAQAQAGSLPLPLQLFSHIDQQTAWWTSLPDQVARAGWGGRIADLYSAQGYQPQLAMNINVGNANYLQAGQQTSPYVLGTDGAAQLNAITAPYRNGLRQQASQSLLQQASSDSNLLVSGVAGVLNSALTKVSIVNNALNAAGDLTTSFPTLPGDFYLGAQLHEVARCIKARSQLGDARQIFFVNIGGFDTHSDQLSQHSTLLSIVSQNLNTFWNAMVEIGAQNNVTLFTTSEFGRTVGANSGSGADHAWGNHHFVMGGAVKGGAFYGKMPSLAIGGADDYGAGRILPTTSTDQYGATLAKWFGVAAADLVTVFPNLANFSSKTLAFV